MDQAFKDKQALIDNQSAELEKASEKGYNDVIIATTTEMKSLKDIIFQDGFEFGLDKAQVPIGHELNRLKVTCPCSVFRTTLETTYRMQVANTRGNAEQAKGQEQQYA